MSDRERKKREIHKKAKFQLARKIKLTRKKVTLEAKLQKNLWMMKKKSSINIL